jgi:hypothetical protein
MCQQFAQPRRVIDVALAARHILHVRGGLRLVSDGQVTTEVPTFQTTTADLLRLSKWLAENG